MFKKFLIWSSSGPPVRWSGTIFVILKKGIMENIHVKLYKLGPVVQEMSFKDMSYLELWQSLCSVDWNHLCSIRRRHPEDQSCEIILNLEQWFRAKQPCEYILSLDQ